MLLITFTFQPSNIGNSQPNLISGNNENVTLDMVNFLSNLTNSLTQSKEITSNSMVNDNNRQVEYDVSNLNYTFISPESILLGNTVLPKYSIMPVYETNPFIISQGHLSANLPCNETYETNINILVGKIPYLRSIPLEPLPDLSKVGEICLYQLPLISNGTNPISQIAIQNNSTDDVYLPLSSSITIGVSKLGNLTTSNGVNP